MLYNISCMDFDEKKKRQLIRVIIAEVGMVLSVAAIVVVSTLAAMGFMISSNGRIEQSGLLQLHSLPTGATVKIDGSTIFSRTNLSRTLTSGEHFLELSREGYDSWEKNIKVYPGVLMRIYYPRLFLQNRTSESVLNLATNNNLEFYSQSSNRNYILYAEKGASDWMLLDIRGDEVKTTFLDLSGILPGMVQEATTGDNKSQNASQNKLEMPVYKFHGTVDELIWSSNEEHVLVKITYEDRSEWVLLHLKDLARSLNITKTFGLGETMLTMIDGSAEQLFVLEKRQLRRINTTDGVMSRILLNDVVDFASYDRNVVYVTEDPATHKRQIGVYRDNDMGGTIIADVPEDKKVQIALSYYYDEDYVAYLLDNQITVLRGKIPAYEEGGADISGLKLLGSEKFYSEIPEKFSVSPEGEYLLAQKSNKMMVMDLEMGDTFEYEAPNAKINWFDASMLYAINDKQQIIVWDFDGTNERNLADSVRASDDKGVLVLNYPVTVTSNNRWLYYLAKGDKFIILTREKIRD